MTNDTKRKTQEKSSQETTGQTSIQTAGSVLMLHVQVLKNC